MRNRKATTLAVAAAAITVTTLGAVYQHEQQPLTGHAASSTLQAGVPTGLAAKDGMKVRAAADPASKVLQVRPADARMKLSCWTHGSDGARWYWLAGGYGYVSAGDLRSTGQTDYCVA